MFLLPYFLYICSIYIYVYTLVAGEGVGRAGLVILSTLARLAGVSLVNQAPPWRRPPAPTAPLPRPATAKAARAPFACPKSPVDDRKTGILTDDKLSCATEREREGARAAKEESWRGTGEGTRAALEVSNC